MESDQDLQWFGQMMGASQLLSDRGMVSMLCPELDGKSLTELTPAEFDQLMASARTFSLGTVPEEEED